MKAPDFPSVEGETVGVVEVQGEARGQEARFAEFEARVGLEGDLRAVAAEALELEREAQTEGETVAGPVGGAWREDEEKTGAAVAETDAKICLNVARQDERGSDVVLEARGDDQVDEVGRVVPVVLKRVRGETGDVLNEAFGCGLIVLVVPGTEAEEAADLETKLGVDGANVVHPEQEVAKSEPVGRDPVLGLDESVPGDPAGDLEVRCDLHTAADLEHESVPRRGSLGACIERELPVHAGDLGRIGAQVGSELAGGR